ncbi:preprotein translocase subunit SecE [Lentilactobacillus sp. SPB1-3]|uniref:Preprotein translocase subunit SecE n=1 Tax=Lentilactobacillus terminaliae TaxID=3003483 RepID=A0ACD5DGZ0_9LACO|nr:preprotein translocase subunit SecE [Lentilactobacillus sp. SPB1-3]MCZ0976892.1 preprotein translocase subunit SecE [Lentilactobacillus sp. SPB1-3]
MRLVNFFKSVVAEMKVVTWPNAKQTKDDTSTVVGTAIIMAIFLGIVDWLVQYGLTFLS